MRASLNLKLTGHSQKYVEDQYISSKYINLRSLSYARTDSHDLMQDN